MRAAFGSFALRLILREIKTTAESIVLRALAAGVSFCLRSGRELGFLAASG